MGEIVSSPLEFQGLGSNLSAPRETTCRAAGRLREVNAEEDSTNRFPAAVERLHRGGPRRH